MKLWTDARTSIILILKEVRGLEMRANFVIRIGAAATLIAVFIPDLAIAGPPYRTDDPEPVDYQHWEFYTFTSGTRKSGDTSGVGPAIEFNYGLIPNGQLHIVAPAAFDRPSGGPNQFGYGDTEIGFKYRFIEEDKQGTRPQVGVFPLVELPTGSQSRGLAAGHVRAFFPLWVQKSSGDWTTYGGGGYWVNQDDKFGDKDFWFFGWLLQRKITEKLTLGGELFHQTVDNIMSKDNTGFNFGGSYDFDEHNHLLFSAGRGFQNASTTNLSSWYLAWQITY
jgi:hypothetical protein